MLYDRTPVVKGKTLRCRRESFGTDNLVHFYQSSPVTSTTHMPDYDISTSEDGHLSPAQRVQKWKDDNTPLSDRQKIAYWMASTFVQEKELYHHKVVQHIFQEHGQHTDLVGTTDTGAYSIDDTILDHF
jgi:hypothetical protein